MTILFGYSNSVSCGIELANIVTGELVKKHGGYKRNGMERGVKGMQNLVRILSTVRLAKYRRAGQETR